MENTALSALIVESNRVERDLIRMALTRLGLSTMVVENGADALVYLQEHPVDLVILDLFLPQQNGLDCLKLWRSLGPLKDIPVIVVSALGFPEVVQRAILTGAQDFLVKPIDTDQLVERVSRLLKLSGN